MKMYSKEKKWSIKALRVNEKKTQREVSDAIGVKLRTYQNYEERQNSIPWEVMKRIAEFYSINLDLIE